MAQHTYLRLTQHLHAPVTGERMVLPCQISLTLLNSIFVVFGFLVVQEHFIPIPLHQIGLLLLLLLCEEVGFTSLPSFLLCWQNLDFLCPQLRHGV